MKRLRRNNVRLERAEACRRAPSCWSDPSTCRPTSVQVKAPYPAPFTEELERLHAADLERSAKKPVVAEWLQAWMRSALFKLAA